MSTSHIPLADAGCECGGHGYAAFACDNAEHPSFEIQSTDDCDCALQRRAGCPAGLDERGDTLAALLFVRDLEDGKPHARSCARLILGETP